MKATVAPFRKLEPVTDNVTAGPSAGAAVGLIDVTTGVGAFTLKEIVNNKLLPSQTRACHVPSQFVGVLLIVKLAPLKQ